MGNPFISTITNSDLADYEAIPTYIPMSLRVIEADPSVEVGDMLSVADLADAYQVLADIYGNVWSVGVGTPEFRLHAKEDGTLYAKSDNHAIGQYRQEYEALSVSSDQFQIPLMERTITYIGHCSATYESTGERWREVDTDMNVQYNANVAPVSQMDVFNRLTNGGQDQGIYIDDGKIYINGEYIRANSINADLIYGGTLSGAEINIGSGAFTVDENGDVGITKGSINLQSPGAFNNLITVFYDYEGTSETSKSEGRVRPYGFAAVRQAYRKSDGVQIGYQSCVVGTEQINMWDGTNEDDATLVLQLWGGMSGGSNGLVIRRDDHSAVLSLTQYGLNIYDSAGVARVSLSDLGLRFYNSSGTLTKSYPST